MKKRILSMLIALVLVLGFVPFGSISVFATDGAQDEGTTATVVTTEAELNVALSSGGEIRLGASIALVSPLYLNGDTILDLAGYTLSTSDDYGGVDMFYLKDEVTNITITNSNTASSSKITASFDGDSIFWFSMTSAHLTIENVAIESAGTLGYAAIYYESQSRLTLENCSVDSVQTIGSVEVIVGEGVEIGEWSIGVGACFNVDPSEWNGFDTNSHGVIYDEELAVWEVAEKRARITEISISGDCYDTEKKLLSVSVGDTFTVTVSGYWFASMSENNALGYLPRVIEFSLPSHGWTIDGDTASKTYTVQSDWISNLEHPHEIVYYNDYQDAQTTIHTGIHIVSKDESRVQSRIRLIPVDPEGERIKDVDFVPWCHLNDEVNLDNTLINYMSLLIGENTVNFRQDDVEGFFWIPETDEFMLVADENGALTVSGHERLAIEKVGDVYCLIIPFKQNPTKVILPLYFKPVDSSGNPIDGLMDARVRDVGGSEVWMGTELMDYSPLVFTIGSGVVYDWDVLPEGYSPYQGVITFDVDAEGNVTITGGNATVEHTEDAVYLVVTLYEEGETVMHEDSVRISGASLSLGADLTVNYTAQINDEDVLAALDQVFMRFTMNGKTTVVALDEELVDDDGHYVFPFAHIAPQQMTDNIKAELLIGDEVVATKDRFNVLFYLWNVAQITESDQTLHLVNSLIDYGYFAQKYTGYSPDTLEYLYPLRSSGYEYVVPTESDKTLVTAEGVTLGDVYFESATVWFDTVNRIGIKLNAITANTRLVVKINDDEIGTPYENLTSTTFYTEGIRAVNFADVYTFELYEGETLLQTLTYSVNSYVYSMMGETEADGETPTDMAALAVALYNYGCVAEAYQYGVPEIGEGNFTEITDENAEAYSYNGETATYDMENGWTPVEGETGDYGYFTVPLNAGDVVYYELFGDTTCVGLANDENDFYNWFDDSLESMGTILIAADGNYTFYTYDNIDVRVGVLSAFAEDEETGGNGESVEGATEISWGGPLEDASYLISAVSVTDETQLSDSVTVGVDGWVAYYNGISNMEIADGLQAYVVIEQDGSRVLIEEITDGIIPLNTPVLLKGVEGTYHLNATAIEGSVESNLLTVSESTLEREDMDMDYIYCVFSVWEQELTAFVSTVAIPAYQPYFIAENNL